jgi:DNA-binding response OmpR family regulator
MKHVLVIDDDRSTCDLIKHYLESQGFEVETAPDGREGIRRYHAHPADLVIVDIFMPHKDGIETIIDLRSQSPEARILAISGGGDMGGMEYLDYARVLGATNTLAKPFDRSSLINAVTTTASHAA